MVRRSLSKHRGIHEEPSNGNSGLRQPMPGTKRTGAVSTSLLQKNVQIQQGGVSEPNLPPESSMDR
ncbi:hypothetical protein N7453_012059 [Penicillium expansum]|nr:hypothetical protein N7453_012059 [Penicillium expansum]